MLESFKERLAHHNNKYKYIVGPSTYNMDKDTSIIILVGYSIFLVLLGVNKYLDENEYIFPYDEEN